ncbi:MAG: hypothetical protein ACOX1A_09585 [Saccharofermentanales bacterium]|nr:hypothetical protein [Clostridiaceae bacterium]
MIALLWLLLAFLSGNRWFDKLNRPPSVWRQTDLTSPWPAALFRFSSALWLGLLPITWLTYVLAALFNLVLPAGIHPLIPANVLVMAGLSVWLIRPKLQQAWRNARLRQDGAKPRWAQYEAQTDGMWPSLIRSISAKPSRLYLLSVLLFLSLGLFLMNGTFGRDGTVYRAGYSVFSDFAPHTALVSSFSQGRNWPTQYPHFANDGISYHFMFFFLCGNLDYLGLPLDWAINLPSLLGLLTFCILLGLLAIRLTGQRRTFLLAPSLLFLRSSLAFFTHLADLLQTYGGWTSRTAVLQALLRQDTFIGNTTNDAWGLWTVNVYANQRHLLPGLSIALLILFLFLPDLENGLTLLKHPKQLFFRCASWQLPRRPDSKRMITAIVLGILLPYFHGAVLVALLLMLVVLAFFSVNRLSYVFFALAVMMAATIQTSVFAGHVAIVPQFQPGFISPDKTLAGCLLYLLEMSGLLLPLALIIFWLPGRRRKVMMTAFLLPLIFAMLISLTPDVTVNHKYIIITFAFLNIYVADFLIKLWTGFRDAGKSAACKRSLSRMAGRSAALVLGLVLMITGIQEIIILRNISRNTAKIDSSSPLVEWIMDNTEPDAVFVSAPYHYHSFYLSGRATWLGHAYYAWSAGHDTAGRLRQEQLLFSGCGGDPASVQEMALNFGIDYFLLDDSLRHHPDFTVDENFFRRYFPISAEFPNSENTIIFDLRRMLN